MSRITKANLEDLLESINAATGNDYVLYWAYGGVALNQRTSADGAVRQILGRGTKSELYWQMQAFRAGLQAAFDMEQSCTP